MVSSAGARPNVIVLMADQHRADALGCAGDPSAPTPNLDALAAGGVRFSRVSCQGPLCMPARASFLTERYVRDHGVYTNWAEVPAGTPTSLHALADAGVRTAMIGKAHLTRDDDLRVAHVDELAGLLRARGYAEVHETGDKFTVEPGNRYTDHLAARGLLDAYRRHVADRSYHGENERGVGATKRVPMWDATPSPVPLADYIDTWHGDAAVRWIEGWRGPGPFHLFVGFPGPHDPWDAPVEAVERYGPAVPSAPRSTRRPDVDGAGNYGKLVRGMLHLSDTDTMDDAAIAGMRRAYLANVGVIDHAVGRIVAALDDRGLLDDTWIVYTSDHGEMAGDHGLMSKCLLYEGAVRVPLVVRPPGGCAPRVVDDLVEHLDVPATVRALLGAGPVPGGEGRSLAGYVTGDDPEPRAVSVSENWGFASFETDSALGRWKLVVDEDRVEPCQLFDLAADPAEDVDLARSPDHAEVVAELLATVVRPFLATPPLRPHPSPFA
jgi:arylsulfatase